MLERLGLLEGLAGLERGAFTAAEWRAACRARVEGPGAKLNAVVDLDPAAGDGIPFLLKDNLCRRGRPTRCASEILGEWIAPYDATVVARLREAGAASLGKTNMDEFGMGSSSEYSRYGPVRNPWDLSRTAGGSSGGSAAAVAAELAPFALGSDTGGSIRQPAALCGVVGVKPTYGRVSRYGLVAFASSLDQIGPVTRDVGDAAWLLERLMGHDPADASSLRAPVPSLMPELERGVKGLRFGVPAPGDWPEPDPAVEKVFASSVEALRAAGAEPVEISLPHARYAVAAYYLIAPAEASGNLARFDGLRYGSRVEGEDLADVYRATRAAGFGPEVKRRILLGTFALSAGYREAYYERAQRVRTLIANDFRSAFETVDFMILPATPEPAFLLGERREDPLALYRGDLYTLPASLAGLPAASVPARLAGGLPLGTQLLAPPLGEAMLIRAAAELERAFPFDEIRRRAAAATLEAP